MCRSGQFESYAVADGNAAQIHDRTQTRPREDQRCSLKRDDTLHARTCMEHLMSDYCKRLGKSWTCPMSTGAVVCREHSWGNLVFNFKWLGILADGYH